MLHEEDESKMEEKREVVSEDLLDFFLKFLFSF